MAFQKLEESLLNLVGTATAACKMLCYQLQPGGYVVESGSMFHGDSKMCFCL